MVLVLFYLLAITSLLIGTAAIYMALIEAFPVKWLYYHYFIRKPVTWTIFCVLLIWTFVIFQQGNQFPFWALVPIIISLLALILSYKMHQENAFRAVDFPEFAKDISDLPLKDEMELAIIEYQGTTKCYPLDYLIHHHIINDKFGSRIVALTYCAMCRSIIPFDVTEIGPLFVGSFKGANMIVADRKTKTFFQQATFKSIIGKLHPYELNMIPFQILNWAEVKKVISKPLVVKVVAKDFREFQLPIPGIWKKIVVTEKTPGLSAKNRDHSFPSRTPVIGIYDTSIKESLVYLKKDVIANRLILNENDSFFLLGMGNTVNGFKTFVNNTSLEVGIENEEIIDRVTGTHWNIRGKYLKGSLNVNLDPIAISDEYWFSWKKFHKDSKLISL